MFPLIFFPLLIFAVIASETLYNRFDVNRWIVNRLADKSRQNALKGQKKRYVKYAQFTGGARR